MIPKKENELCKSLLKLELEPSEDDSIKGFMTKGGDWYFEETNQPVIGRPTIGFPDGRPTGRMMWKIQRAITIGGSYWEPPDCDIVDVGEPQESLWSAIKEASRLDHEDTINGHCESVAMSFYEQENKEAEDYMAKLANENNEPKE